MIPPYGLCLACSSSRYKGFRSSVATANRLMSSRDASMVQGRVSRPIQERISSVMSDACVTIVLPCCNIDSVSQRSIATKLKQVKASQSKSKQVSGKSKRGLGQVKASLEQEGSREGQSPDCLDLS